MAGAEAHIHMPAIVPGRFWRGKADRKGSEALGRKPAAFPDELIVGFVKLRCVGGSDEGERELEPHPNNGLNPFLGLIRQQTYIGPQFVPTLFCKVGAEGIFQFDETIVNEALDLTGSQADMLDFGHYTFSVRLPRQAEPFDPNGAKAPERLSVVQIRGKNVDINIMRKA
ncbi:hypothetical protein GCM10010836_24260 [Aminobacter aminovorans]